MDVQAAVMTEKGGHRLLVTVDGRTVETPPIEHMLFYVALAGLVQAQLVELPVALALGIGHAILDITRRPGLVAIGEALEEA